MNKEIVSCPLGKANISTQGFALIFRRGDSRFMGTIGVCEGCKREFVGVDPNRVPLEVVVKDQGQTATVTSCDNALSD